MITNRRYREYSAFKESFAARWPMSGSIVARLARSAWARRIKTYLKFSLVLILLSPLMVQLGYGSCASLGGYVPVYMSFDELRSAFAVHAARDILMPGKFVVKDQIIFISDVNLGVHVIDNTDPRHPYSLSFLEIPGNHDIAVFGDTLYADSYVDLLAIDISTPETASVINRLNDLYPNNPYGDQRQSWATPIDETRGVVIGRQELAMGPCNDVHGGRSCSWFGSGSSHASSAASGVP